MSNKIGLVLAGGGGKGPYEIGVWKAMDELGLAQDIAAVSGTSVGALNAALFAQGDLAKAEQAWLSMSPSDVLSFDLKRVIAAVVKRGIVLPHALLSLLSTAAMFGLFSRKGLERIINEYLDIDLVSQRDMPYFACATRITTFSPTYFTLQGYDKDTLRNILLASSAIPGIFPSEKVAGTRYWDGFLTDNTPIKPLAEHGCNIIIAVMLSRSALLPVDSYPNCKIIPIYPQEDAGWALNFNGVQPKMQRGYDDAMSTLKPVFELIETNYQYSVELQKYKKQELQFQQQLETSRTLGADLSVSQDNLLKELRKW
ncbi:TPA: patatin-like phospholipase family protein [Vibrio parahaemolyticus]|nr:patatin-like phospholipase family protein [Vibrio parahaemolyticus]HCH5494728.1 patatin-like phospholipase family protein [Vibrio parahaemolyticus]HCH6275965.1 patatin-like phospholipase family protein [Vibrio parahaemolyticus]HCH6312410.1 patatin-like phospholipase family protein [Vibrio parahaemolyticus]HCH6482996.1 patatin-like phospholipase family protein [Vibrio parahaemolyticus]